MEEFSYKLVMFGFSALCEDLEEVKRRLSIYPIERYTLENGDECFLVDLKTREVYPILLKNNRFVIDKL
ncbi:hypothetical protein [Helicobacter winghamensis]|uniref:Uncharacterized protein n=1 Tax=Helicobacter winghamensis TaxID=157268 RepID=A0A2N3PIJ9_9HELI|nr:hypothetical protein [Helicobacter winghamensis]EEO25615.1 hypothetical protein HWAG_00407 [Helicobacter winghamensis ATCC BAA-430]PKT76116.1 hypothetical protein BCM32_07670 [Helicobacter winghamensis]PKT76751.1 hypothetical protein BCM35_08050 [Helicobacter winghamensis]PKT76872.1 hypothetical protein BCM34_01800 [Helicobacter winghamensis]PKT80627.1 hypothetical protein BCM31_04010 [Helicobacter winghamensis]